MSLEKAGLASGFVKGWDLAAEVSALELRKPWPKGLTSTTLLKSKDLRIVLIAMQSGAQMQRHHSDGRISIHILRGSIRVHVQGQEKKLSAGGLLALDRSLKHDVEALEDCAFLLTIAWPSNEELLAVKHRGYGA